MAGGCSRIDLPILSPGLHLQTPPELSKRVGPLLSSERMSFPETPQLASMDCIAIVIAGGPAK